MVTEQPPTDQPPAVYDNDSATDLDIELHMAAWLLSYVRNGCIDGTEPTEEEAQSWVDQFHECVHEGHFSHIGEISRLDLSDVMTHLEWCRL